MNERKVAAAVDAWAAMHRDELVNDVMRLVRIPSIAAPGEGGYAMGTGCHLAAEELMKLGGQYGFACENDADYCVSVISPGNPGGRELGILGHIDVVPAGEGWKHEPFQAVEQNGYIIGRGSADNKGPVIMALYVMRCLRDTGISLRHDLRLIAGCDEEGGMRDVQHYLQGHRPPDYTLNCDGAWPVCIGEKGILTTSLEMDIADGNLLAIGGGSALNAVADEAWALLSSASPETLADAAAQCKDLTIEQRTEGVLLRVKGKSAHCSAPETGSNAICHLLDVLCEAKMLEGDAAIRLERLRKCFPDQYGTGLRVFHEDRLSGKTTCVPTLIRMASGTLSLNVNIRFAITQKSALLMTAMRKRCEKLGIRLGETACSEPRCDPPEQPVIQLLLDVCREYIHPKCKPYVTGGGTHSRLFPKSVPFGPELILPGVKTPFGRPHGADEAVCISHLLQGIKAYALALFRLDDYFDVKI